MQDTPLAVTFDALLSKGMASLKTSLVKALNRDDLSAALKDANEDYAQKGGRDLDAALTYAILLTHRELTDEAMGVLRKAIEHHSHNPALQLAQVDVLLVRGDVDSARALAEGLSAVSFTEPRHTAYLGDAYLSMDMLDEALNAFVGALDAGLDDASVAANAAHLLIQKGLHEQAAEMYERAGRIAPSVSEYYLRAADMWLEAGELERSVRAYRRVVNMEPDNAHAWTFLGFAYRDADDPEASLEAFQKAYKLEPDDMESVLNLAHAYLEVGQSEQARRYYEKAAEIDPEEVEAVNGMVAAAFELGDVELAESLALRAVDMDPENPDGLYNLGVIQLSINHTKDAEINFRLALEMQPEDPRYAIAIAQVVLRKGKVDEAMSNATVATAYVIEDATGIYDFVRDLVRFGGADRVLEFVEEVESLDVRWAAIKPLFEYLAHALRREEDAYVDCLTRFEDAVKEFPEIIPVMWDFEELERLALGLEPRERKTLETMIAVLEGRRDLGHLEQAGK
ncbi:MAG: tetratricopeptide repeat protein [bacterium]